VQVIGHRHVQLGRLSVEAGVDQSIDLHRGRDARGHVAQGDDAAGGAVAQAQRAPGGHRQPHILGPFAAAVAVGHGIGDGLAVAHRLRVLGHRQRLIRLAIQVGIQRRARNQHVQQVIGQIARAVAARRAAQAEAQIAGDGALAVGPDARAQRREALELGQPPGAQVAVLSQRADHGRAVERVLVGRRGPQAQPIFF
jgi:hypothetical protein